MGTTIALLHVWAIADTINTSPIGNRPYPTALLQRFEFTMFAFIWIFKIAAWLVAKVALGLLVDNLLFGPPKIKKRRATTAQSTDANRETTS